MNRFHRSLKRIILALSDTILCILSSQFSPYHPLSLKRSEGDILIRLPPPQCRYQFNPHLTNSETITNILVKALTAFPSSDFSLCRHLLPPNFLPPIPNATELTEAVQKLTTLNSLLESCNFKEFWNTLDSDDLFADLIADVQGFEDTIRRRITGVDTSDVEARIPGVIDSSMREIERTMLEDWLNLRDEKFEDFVTSVAGYQIDGNTVIISLNKDNEAKPTITRESVKIDQFSRVIRRAYEQPA
ncbi:hypothetical protein TWF751_000381 [Orbilia oligospora]|nr:hypothetical protein TWF751_000381 [Orbilia oligospora]